MEKGQDIILPWSKPLDLRFLSYTPVPDTLWQRKDDHTLQDMHNYCEPDQQDLIADYNHTKGVVGSPPTILRFLFILHLSISAPVAGRLVATDDSLSVPDATSPMTFIVHCHPQTVSKLPAESKERDRVRHSNEELCFIPWQLPHGVNWVSLTGEPLSSPPAAPVGIASTLPKLPEVLPDGTAHWIQAARGANSTRWHPPPP